MVQESSSAIELGLAVGRRRRSWPPLALALAGAGAYAVFFVLPYYVNDLDRYPLDEVASGYHDPKDLWPSGTPLAFVFAVGGLFTLAFGPLVAAGAAAWAAVLLWLKRTDRDLVGRLLLVLAAAISVGTLLWLTSSFASALMRWWLD